MLKRKKTVIFLVVLSALLLLLAAGAPAMAAAKTGAGSQEKIKVAFIYVGPVGDAGWTYSHDQARKFLEKQLPYVETTFVESVPEGADSERVLIELAQKGNQVIFATSFGYMDAVINVAKKFPNVVFEHCSGYKTAANVGTYFGRIEEPRYLSGMVAGRMTRKNLIGYVAAHPIPEVIRGINAFTLGVLAVNPKARVKVVWTNTWYDPAAEKEAAKSLLDVGADVITQHQDTPAPQQAAQEKGAFGIGYNSDMSAFAPKAFLTAPVWNWGPFYVDVVKRVKEGTWKSSQYWGSMAGKTVGLAQLGPMVPNEVKAVVKQEQDQIMSGKFTIFDIFQGPLKDQKGEIRVPAGKKMTGEEILGMSWFVQGVEGTIPK